MLRRLQNAVLAGQQRLHVQCALQLGGRIFSQRLLYAQLPLLSLVLMIVSSSVSTRRTS